MIFFGLNEIELLSFGKGHSAPVISAIFTLNRENLTLAERYVNRGRNFSCVRPFYERAVSNRDS